MRALKYTYCARQNRKLVVNFSLACLVVGLWTTVRHDITKDHYLSTELASRSFALDADDQTHWSPDIARSICRAHNFNFDAKQQQRRKVYDLFLLSTELDWLDVRLHTLTHFVDYFVVIESPTTFTGKSKPLYLNENWVNYKEFHDKIIYRVVEDSVQSRRIWDHEDFFRNSLLESVFPGLNGTAQQPNVGDVLVVSDIDEIIRPEAALLLRHCSIPARLTLRTSFYYYSFQWRYRGPQWSHPDATVYQGHKTILPNDLRQNLLGGGWAPIASLRRWWDSGTLWNAGWHCSSCFASVAEMRTKMHSFSHQKWNTANNRELDTIVDRVRNGKDLFDRVGEYYDKIENNLDVPPYILEQHSQSGKFRYLINRDGKEAGFNDTDTITEHDV